MACKSSIRLTEKDRSLLDRLLNYRIECRRQTHTLHEWCRLIARGKVDEYTLEILEQGGMRVEKQGRSSIVKLSNPKLKSTAHAVYYNTNYFHKLPLNTLLRRAGGWACGTVRFGGKPQRATAIPLYTLARLQNRYNPQA